MGTCIVHGKQARYALLEPPSRLPGALLYHCFKHAWTNIHGPLEHLPSAPKRGMESKERERISLVHSASIGL